MPPILSRNQRRFARELVRQTGLHPHLVGAWIISEQPAGASHPVGHRDQNWLNIGLTDTRWYDGASSWKNPVQAARRSAAWLQGREAVPGFGKAAPGIVNFSRTAGKPLGQQIAALQKSGWASSGYPNLPQVVQQNAGKYGIGVRGGAPAAQPGMPTVERGPARYGVQTRTSFDAEGFDAARRQFVLGQILQRVDSPFRPGRRSILPSLLPQEPPERVDYTSAVSSLKRMAGGLKVVEPRSTGRTRGVAKMPRGGGYAGTEAIIRKIVDPVAGRFGITGSSYKRDRKHTSSGGISDHWVGSTNSYAGDYPATGETGAKLAHRIAKRLGIKGYRTGTYDGWPVKIGGRSYRAQILWNVDGHYDHVHVGLQAV